MRHSGLLGLRATLAAVAAVAATAIGIQSGPAHAGPTYWTFKNVATGHCLTAGVASGQRVWAATCSGNSYQQWDWITSNVSNVDQMLRNRATGLCLRTDSETEVNAIWQSSCDRNAQGELFGWDASPSYLWSAPGFGAYVEEWDGGAVHSDSGVSSDRARWYGSHT